jgi:hypothetical protein
MASDAPVALSNLMQVMWTTVSREINQSCRRW